MTLWEQEEMSFPISLFSGFGELGQGCTVWGLENSGHGVRAHLGKWISICFLGPENKQTIKKTGQMAALVKTEDIEDRDKHEGPRGRSWGSGEPLALDRSISAHRILRASLGVAVGTTQGWLALP